MDRTEAMSAIGQLREGAEVDDQMGDQNRFVCLSGEHSALVLCTGCLPRPVLGKTLMGLYCYQVSTVESRFYDVVGKHIFSRPLFLYRQEQSERYQDAGAEQGDC